MKTKLSFWDYSKGKIFFYYLLVVAVGFINGWFQNSTGDFAVYTGSLIGMFIAPLIALVVGWGYHNWNAGKTKEQHKKEDMIAWIIIIAVILIITLAIIFFS